MWRVLVLIVECAVDGCRRTTQGALLCASFICDGAAARFFFLPNFPQLFGSCANPRPRQLGTWGGVTLLLLKPPDVQRPPFTNGAPHPAIILLGMCPRLFTGFVQTHRLSVLKEGAAFGEWAAHCRCQWSVVG